MKFPRFLLLLAACIGLVTGLHAQKAVTKTVTSPGDNGQLVEGFVVPSGKAITFAAGSTITLPDNALAIGDVSGLQAALDLKAPLASPTLSNPTFTGTVTVPDGALAIADTSGLQAALNQALQSRSVADRLVADHTGWQLGDVIHQTGVAGTIVLPDILSYPGDESPRYIIIDPGTGGGTIEYYFDGDTTARTAAQMATFVAAQLTALELGSFTAAGTTISGVLGGGVVSAFAGIDTDLSLDSATFTDSVAAGKYTVVDVDNLSSADGYAPLVADDSLKANADGSNVSAQAGAWRTALNVPGLDSSSKVASASLYSPTSSVLLDFRQMPDGPVSTIKSQQGEYLAFTSTNPEKFAISGGRLIATDVTAPYCYVEVRLPDLVRQAWAIVDFADVATLRNNAFVMLGMSAPPSWAGGSGKFTVHPTAFAKVLNNPAGYFQGGSFLIPGAIAPAQNGGPVGGYTFPGRRVRFDTVFDPILGRVTLYVDRMPVLTYRDTALPPWAGKTAVVEFDSVGISIAEFGASTRAPGDLYDEVVWAARGSFFANAGALSGSWLKLWDLRVVYPPSGAVEITWNPEITSTSGAVEMALGPTSGSAPDVAAYYQVVAGGAFRGRPHYSQTRTGTPGTLELVSIWAKTTGAASTSNQGGEGPRVRPIVTTTINNP